MHPVAVPIGRRAGTSRFGIEGNGDIFGGKDLSVTLRGRHFLQLPGPSNVPDRILRAIDRPTIDHRGPEFAELGKWLLEGLGLSLTDRFSRERVEARGLLSFDGVSRLLNEHMAKTADHRKHEPLQNI